MQKGPLYKTIELDLLEKIESGIYPENSIIPKEIELTTIYNVSRPTIRQAIQNLVNQGYLERKKRLGTIVRRHKIDQEFTTIIESFDSEMRRKGLSPTTTVISFKIDTANEEVARNLNIMENDEIFKLIRLRYAEGDPVVIVTTYVPKNKIPQLQQYDFTSTSLYDVFSKEGSPITKIKRKLDVLVADETTSDLLDIEIGAPLFYFHSTGFTSNGVVMEYSISKYRGDTNSFVFEIANTPT